MVTDGDEPMKPPLERSEPDDRSKAPEGSDKVEPEAMADDLLVHALLRGRYEDTPEAMQSRLERVCRCFERAQPIVWRPWRLGLSTAAAAVVVLGLILVFSSPRDVQADFGQVLDAFDAGDKTYRVEVGDQFGLSPRPFRPGSRRGGRGPGHPRLGRRTPQRLDGAALYTRGRKYVLVFTTRTGRQIAKGFDGRQSWLIGPWHQPRLGNDPNLLQQDIPDDVASLLFLDLRDILHQVRAEYRLDELADAAAPNGRLPMRHFVARRRSQQSALPERIELWFDPQTDQLEQILCVEAGLRGRRRHTLRISLVAIDPLPLDWFTAHAHSLDRSTP